MKKFVYMPRISLIPSKYAEERMERLVRCCKEYKYDEVIFFFNGECLFQGFMTMEELSPYVELVKRAKERLEKEGIKISANPWTTLVAGDRGRKMRPQFGFATMVDVNGKAAQTVVCPLCEKWLAYQCEYLGFLAKELSPNIVWVEDDLRLVAHSPLKWGGCFCDKHMKLYGEALGRVVTREEFVVGMADNRENGVFRKAYFNVNRKVFNDVTTEMQKYVHSVAPDVKIGLMSGDPKTHSIEGRDWHGMLYSLAGKHKPVHRVHMPMYRQFTAQQFCWGFNTISLLSRALSPEETEIYPEVENAKFSLYTKSRNMTRFQTETTLALCPDGVTFDMDCFAGTGIVEKYGYGKKLAEIKNYFNGYAKKKIPFSSMNGIQIPISEDGFLRAPSCERLEQLCNDENYWAGHFASTGISFKFTKERAFKNQMVAVSGNWLNSISDEEIEDLFANNFVVLEGLTVKVLFERRLQHLIHAKSYVEWEADHNEELGIEEAEEGRIFVGMRGARATTMVTCSPFLNIEYTQKPVVYTNILDCREKYMCPSFVRFDNCFIMPYLGMGRRFGLLTDLRTEALKAALEEVKESFVSPLIYGEEPYLSTYFYQTEDADYLLIMNFSDDDYENVRLHGLKDYKGHQSLNRTSGEWENVVINKDGIWEQSFMKATTTAFLKLIK